MQIRALNDQITPHGNLASRCWGISFCTRVNTKYCESVWHVSLKNLDPMTVLQSVKMNPTNAGIDQVNVWLLLM